VHWLSIYPKRHTRIEWTNASRAWILCRYATGQTYAPKHICFSLQRHPRRIIKLRNPLPSMVFINY
jgi:hypothetical protein